MSQFLRPQLEIKAVCAIGGNHARIYDDLLASFYLSELKTTPEGLYGLLELSGSRIDVGVRDCSVREEVNRKTTLLIKPNIIDLEFELMQKNKKKEKWTEEELQLLHELYPQFVSKKWKQIAENFREKGYSRTEIECREKWINFLDPELNNQDWEESELQKLYQIHDQVGTKWCVIQKYIGRTQNKIKNRFYGTLRNYARFVVNYLQDSEKSFNFEIGKLSPKFLNNMYKAQNQFRFLNDQIRDTIFEMRFKVDRNMLAERIKLKKTLYLRLKALIIKAFRGIHRPEHLTPEAAVVSLAQQQPVLVKNEESKLSQHVVQPALVKEIEKGPQLNVEREEIERSRPEMTVFGNYYPFMNIQFNPFSVFSNDLYWQ